MKENKTEDRKGSVDASDILALLQDFQEDSDEPEISKFTDDVDPELIELEDSNDDTTDSDLLALLDMINKQEETSMDSDILAIDEELSALQSSSNDFIEEELTNYSELWDESDLSNKGQKNEIGDIFADVLSVLDHESSDDFYTPEDFDKLGLELDFSKEGPSENDITENATYLDNNGETLQDNSKKKNKKEKVRKEKKKPKNDDTNEIDETDETKAEKGLFGRIPKKAKAKTVKEKTVKEKKQKDKKPKAKTLKEKKANKKENDSSDNKKDKDKVKKDGKKGPKSSEKSSIKKAKKAPKKSKTVVKKEGEQGTEESTPINKGILLALAGLLITVSVGVIFLTQIYTSALSVKVAEWNFERGRYDKAYEEIAGQQVNASNREIHDKVTAVMNINHFYESSFSLYKLEMYPEALDSLLQGLRNYDKNIEQAKVLGIENNLKELRNNILIELKEKYHLTENKAVDLAYIENKLEYSKGVHNAVSNIK